MLHPHASFAFPGGRPRRSRSVLQVRKERGLTLVELLIAVALLGFVLLGIAPLFIASVKSNYAANEYTSIHVLARDRLEQLMNLTFDDPKLGVGIYSNDVPSTLPDPTNPAALSTVRSPYTVTYQVTQWRIPPAAGAGSPGSGAPFTPTRVSTANNSYHYKRIDVQVSAGTLFFPLVSSHIGFGARVSRVSGVLNNPEPLTDLSFADPCPGGPGCFF